MYTYNVVPERTEKEEKSFSRINFIIDDVRFPNSTENCSVYTQDRFYVNFIRKTGKGHL